MPDPAPMPRGRPLSRWLRASVLYTLLGAGAVALLAAAIRYEVKLGVRLSVPPALGKLTAELTERRELLIDRLGILQHLALSGGLSATDYLAAHTAYSRIRARHEGCIDWILLALETDNTIPQEALDCLWTKPAIPEALSTERVDAALRAAAAAAPGAGLPILDPNAPHPQSEDGGRSASILSGTGLAEVIDLERKLRDAALDQEVELQKLRARTRGSLALLIERWR